MTYDPTLTAAAVVTVIAAVGGAVVQIINAVSAMRARRDAAADRAAAAAERAAIRAQTATVVKTSEETARKADAIIDKTTEIHGEAKEIHGLANGQMSRLTTLIDVQTERIAGLEKLIAERAGSKLEIDAAQAKLLERADAAPAIRIASAPFGRRASDQPA